MKLKDLSDEKLVDLVTNKNKEYYSEIIERYESKLLSYVRRLTSGSPEARDIVQNTLIKVYENLKGFDQNKKFSSWVYRIAHNEAINWLRKKKASISLDEDDFKVDFLKSNGNIFKKITDKEGAERINALINELPQKYKEPFILKFFEHKTYVEISDILRMPKNTVGTMISRARRTLKKELKKLP
ncbi:MAG: sigma-70 family RNA polymerase sigma factor [Candidatus Moranbacteria bacterium]|nr:sigma-70 family RNA polymerase sigma factor [Candidatus Moranbacteria bacterium]